MITNFNTYINIHKKQELEFEKKPINTTIYNKKERTVILVRSFFVSANLYLNQGFRQGLQEYLHVLLFLYPCHSIYNVHLQL